MKTTRVAIVGASGYSGEELVRLLLAHPHAELAMATSRQYAGRSLADVFPRFGGYAESRRLRFVEPEVTEMAREAEVIFLALPHGVAAEFAVPLLEAGRRVIDLSADFRLHSAEVYREFYGQDHPAPHLLHESVYGLPEHYRNEIRGARLVASPGCYPTGILLPVLPLIRAGLIDPAAIVADSLSGVSGAGRSVKPDLLFVECHESMRAYGVPHHRHLSEIEQEIGLAAGRAVRVQFTPHLIPVNRGILTTLYLEPEDAANGRAGMDWEGAIRSVYTEAYAKAAFVRVLTGDGLPDTKNVVGTNFLELAWRHDSRTGRLIVISAEDNILKGAGGQAVQSFNIMCDYPETAGLM